MSRRARRHTKCRNSSKERSRIRFAIHVGAVSALALGVACETPTEPEVVGTSADVEAPSLDHGQNQNRRWDRQPLVVEFEGARDFARFGEEGDKLGWSRLKRSKRGLKARVRAKGLKPGGVFTFWWIVVPEAAPNDPHVALGGSAIVGRNGKIRVRMRARTGDPGIEGFPPLMGGRFGDLVDPMNALVRVEVAYHGQVKDARGDLKQWMSDFWTGTACPDDGELNARGQPHCPVYIAATHPGPKKPY